MAIAYRSLFTIHDDIQNSTGLGLSLDNSTTPPPAPVAPHWLASPHWHGRLLSGLLVALNVLLVLLLYICFCKFFFRKRGGPSSSPDVDSSPDSSPLSSPRTNATRALQLQVLNSLPVLEFRCSGVGKPEECAVCLAEFKDGDKARVLPRCQHQFHVDCVDTWCRSHATCPLCRTPVEESTGAGSESAV